MRGAGCTINDMWDRDYDRQVATDGARLLTRVTAQGGMASNRKSRFRLDTRNTFFTLRMVRHWNRLLRDVLGGPLLEAFKAKLYGAASNLVYCKVSLPTIRGL